MSTVEIHQITAFQEFVEQFKSETDRAAVILGAAKLDYLLFQLIDKKLVVNYSKEDDLLDDGRPLASFSARICLAYRLGIIDSSFAKALHLIRKTRNDFAHNVPDGRLDLAPHRDRVRELTALINHSTILRDIKEAYFKEKQEPAANFFAMVTLLAVRLEILFMKCETIDEKNSSKIISSDLKQKQTGLSGGKRLKNVRKKAR